MLQLCGGPDLLPKDYNNDKSLENDVNQDELRMVSEFPAESRASCYLHVIQALSRFQAPLFGVSLSSRILMPALHLFLQITTGSCQTNTTLVVTKVLHDCIDRLWLDEDRYWKQSCHLEALDGITAHVEDTMFALKEIKQDVRQRSPFSYNRSGSDPEPQTYLVHAPTL